MTNSAKQGTAKTAAGATGAEPAEQESASTKADTATTADTATAEATASPDAAPDPDEAKPELDETKRKFREALERKNHTHSEGQGNSGREGSKINNAHGPASSRRNFRRKSG